MELTVTMGILTLVVGSLFAVFFSAQRSQAFAQDRSESLDDLRIAMNQVTKEIRQASDVSTASTISSITITTYVNGSLEQVTWRVNAGTLERVNNWGEVAPVLLRVVSTTVFTYSPSAADAQVVRIRLQSRPARSPDTVLELTSEIRLRNKD